MLEKPSFFYFTILSILQICACISTKKIGHKVSNIISKTTQPPQLKLPDENEDRTNQIFISTKHGIILDHIDFLTFRVQQLLKGTSSNITELLSLQQKEFDKNKVYEKGWNEAKQIYNKTNIFGNSSLILNAPVELHIALVAFSRKEISIDFNLKTIDFCSGMDINDFNYKSFFKLLHLAIENFSTLNETVVLYRALDESLDLKKGQKLAFPNFISASRNLSLVKGRCCNVLEFKANGISMEAYSSQDEFLLSPLHTFQVEKVEYGGYKKYILLTVPIPETEKCELSPDLSKMNDLERYLQTLQLAVIVLGVVISGFVLVLLLLAIMGRSKSSLFLGDYICFYSFNVKFR